MYCSVALSDSTDSPVAVVMLRPRCGLLWVPRPWESDSNANLHCLGAAFGIRIALAHGHEAPPCRRRARLLTPVVNKCFVSGPAGRHPRAAGVQSLFQPQAFAHHHIDVQGTLLTSSLHEATSQSETHASHTVRRDTVSQTLDGKHCNTVFLHFY